MARWPKIGGFLAGCVSRRHRVLLACAIVLIAVGVVVGAGGDAPQAVPEALVGTWEGKAKFWVPLFEEGASQSQHSDKPVAIRIRIAADGSVEGQVGTAHLVGCKLKRNRGWWGKTLHLATDYIICDGRLEGPVLSTDRKAAKRSFTIPFNEDGGTLKGGFMVLQKGSYPFPMFPGLQLTKQPAANTPEATR